MLSLKTAAGNNPEEVLSITYEPCWFGAEKQNQAINRFKNRIDGPSLMLMNHCGCQTDVCCKPPRKV